MTTSTGMSQATGSRTAGEIIRELLSRTRQLEETNETLGEELRRERDERESHGRLLFLLMGAAADQSRAQNDSEALDMWLGYQATASPEMFRSTYGVDPQTGIAVRP